MKQAHLLLCLLVATVEVASALSRERRVKSFPSCVEIVDVNPPPNSVVETYEDDTIWFELTFSKPVTVRGKKHSYRVFLSPSPRGINYDDAGIRTWQRTPDLIQKTSTSRLKWEIRFNLNSWPRWWKSSISNSSSGKEYNTLYLVIDGGVFYSHDYITSEYFHQIPVPLSIFGEYYTRRSEKVYRGNQPVQPLFVSPYCRPEPVRSLPEPVGSTGVVESFVSIEIPERGHMMADNPEEPNTLHLLALVNVTEGKTTAPLPRSVTVQISGVDYNVQLPAWNLTFDIPLTMWRAEFTQKLVYDLVERIYLTRERRYFLTNQEPLKIAKLLHKNGALFAQPSLHVTEGTPTGPRSMEVFDGHTNVKLLEFQGKRFDQSGSYYQWYERAYTGAFYYRSRYHAPPDPSRVQTTKEFLQNNVKRCPINSTRNRGRLGTLYHTIEYGRLYQMVVLRDPSHWTLRRANGAKEINPPMYVAATTSKGETVALSKKVQFGWKNKGISSRLVKAMTEDYVCLQAIPTEGQWNKFSMEEICIFVPMSVAESKECGGLRLFENISGIIHEPQFCDKKMGDCIGDPFSSVKRFPVIPPYGAPELAGWTLVKNTNTKTMEGEPFIKSPLMRYRTWGGDKDKTERYVYVQPSSHLYQLDVHHIPVTGVTVLFPHVEIKKRDFCRSVWKLETSSDVLSSVSLTAHIHNTGQGGGSFVVGVNCSSGLQAFPSSPVTLWIDKGSQEEVRFRLSVVLASHRPTAKHTCRMSVEIKTAKQFADKIQQFPECTQSITTYHGIFNDPCKVKEVHLPAVDLKYYILPAEQMEPLARDSRVLDWASETYERKFSLVKAITISLGVPDFQHDLMGNLKQLHVHCGRPDVLITRSYGEFLVHQALRTGTAESSHPSLVLTGGDINLNTAFFFLPKRDPEATEEPVYTDCWAELWANRPHPLCDQPTLLSYVAIPLRDHDQSVFEGKHSRLSVVYGAMSGGGVRALLIGCIVMSVILIVSGSTVHGILFLLKKRLPRTSTLKKYQKDLQNATKADTEYWENPQMFLTSGPHGPFYKLHSFRATDALDTEHIKNLKIAGTLRYENKELQVLFGHVKKVYLDKARKKRDIWIQASSGMYQLSPDQVATEYREEYCSLMMRHGIKMNTSDFNN